MNILLAPDSFKGSISARELCAVMRRGIESVNPFAVIEEVPIADGGEGTVDALIYASGGTIHEVEVSDPLGRTIIAQYGVLGDGKTAVIEMAKASGLPLLKSDERNPLVASSRGTGELILHAVHAGYRSFIIGLGGSATNDGGAGMLSALGVKLLDEQGKLLPDGGAALQHLDTMDVSDLEPLLSQCRFVLASDVTNPLCGERGASVVFGPQKGASVEQVAWLDMALARYGCILEKHCGVNVASFPGSGAAGGMGAAFMGMLGATSRSGIEVMMEALEFDKKAARADVVITGEGRLDEQTMSGKVIAGICTKAAEHGVPVIAICGELSLSPEQIAELGLQAAFSIVPGPCDVETAMQKAGYWVERQCQGIMSVLAINAMKDMKDIKEMKDMKDINAKS